MLKSDCVPTAYEEFDSLAFKLKQRGLDAYLLLNEPIHWVIVYSRKNIRKP